MNLKDSSPSLPPIIENVFHANPALSLWTHLWLMLSLGQTRTSTVENVTRTNIARALLLLTQTQNQLLLKMEKGVPGAKDLYSQLSKLQKREEHITLAAFLAINARGL